MVLEKSTPTTRAVGAGLNAARHGRSDDVLADTPIVVSAPRDPKPSGRPQPNAFEKVLALCDERDAALARRLVSAALAAAAEEVAAAAAEAQLPATKAKMAAEKLPEEKAAVAAKPAEMLTGVTNDSIDVPGVHPPKKDAAAHRASVRAKRLKELMNEEKKMCMMVPELKTGVSGVSVLEKRKENCAAMTNREPFY